jgi:hypothetical protein
MADKPNTVDRANTVVTTAAAMASRPDPATLLQAAQQRRCIQEEARVERSRTHMQETASGYTDEAQVDTAWKKLESMTPLLRVLVIVMRLTHNGRDTLDLDAAGAAQPN